MKQVVYHAPPQLRGHRWSIWLLWLVLLGFSSFGAAWGQSTAPFAVRVTPVGPLSITSGTSQKLTATAVYPAFNIGAGFNGNVYATAIQTDGKILVGGNFTTYNSITRNYLARLNIDGSLDTSFTTGTELNGSVYAIAVQASGDILIGGNFTTYNGTSRLRLARISAAGVLDQSFVTSSATGGFDGTVRAIGVQTTGSVVVGGEFTAYGTNTASKYLVRLDSKGNLDTGFANITHTTNTNYFNAAVLAVVVQSDDNILVGGRFVRFISSGRAGIARLSSNGTLDASFASSANSGPTGSGINAIAEFNGKIVVGGSFGGYTSNGTAYPHSCIALLTSMGELDPNFTSGFSLLTSSSVNSIVVQAATRIVVGGQFTAYSGASYNNLVGLTATGSPDPGFSVGTGFSTIVNSLALQANNYLVAGGQFSTYNGTATKYIARLKSTGGFDNSDTAVGNATYAWSNGSTGPALTVVASGTYSATATVAGLMATSNAVVVGGNAAPFSVRVTPTGPLRVCPGDAQMLVAQAVTNSTNPLPGSVSYQWARVSGKGTTVMVVSTTNTYTVPASAADSVRYYVATATSGAFTAASATLTITAMPLPTVALAAGAPTAGQPGTQLKLSGTNLHLVTGVSFGSQAAAFTLTSPTELVTTVPGIGYSGSVTVTTPCATASTAGTFRILPSISSFAPQAGPVGTTVVVTGTGLSTATQVSFVKAAGGTVAATPMGLTATGFSVVVPPGATTGVFTVTAGTGTAVSPTRFVVTNGSTITVSASTPFLPPPPYTNVVVLPNTTLTLTQNITISGQLIVRSGATLNTGLYQVAGSGGLVLEAGATLLTAHAQGISATGATGAILLTGTRSYSPDASYGYTGTTAQVTGDGLPSQVRNLRCANTTGLTLTDSVAVAQVLTMAGAGNLTLNGKMLTLLSGPTGTALVYNQGTGVVVGPATVQRYIDPRVNPTAGFRYYGAPVRGATATQLLAPAFAYDQARNINGVRRDTTAAINYGFVPGPLLPSTALEPGQGYRAAVPAATTVSFVGTLTTDTLSLRLARSLPAPYSGWNLVSNPYPSPLNWNKVLPADRVGLDAAIYVYESTGPGTGYFRSYVNGVGNGDSLIAVGQAFFVHVSSVGTGRLRFRNSQRITAFDNATQPTFNRTAQLQDKIAKLEMTLERNGHGCPCRLTNTNATQIPVPAVLNTITVYTPTDANPAATTGFDPLLDADAGNLFSPVQQTLGMRSSGSDTLAVQALPGFSATTITEVPLTLSATTPGAYTFTASARNLPELLNGAAAYLRDASVTPNLYTPLTNGTTVGFTLSAAELLLKNPSTRFYLHFGLVKPLATAPGITLQSATVYPNPTHERIEVQVAARPGATQVQATLFTMLGQVVLRHMVALPTTGTTFSLPVPSLASGVYLLRLQVGDTSTTHRVVLE